MPKLPLPLFVSVHKKKSLYFNSYLEGMSGNTDVMYIHACIHIYIICMCVYIYINKRSMGPDCF